MLISAGSKYPTVKYRDKAQMGKALAHATINAIFCATLSKMYAWAILLDLLKGSPNIYTYWVLNWKKAKCPRGPVSGQLPKIDVI